MPNIPNAVKDEAVHDFAIHGFVDDDQFIAIVDAGLIVSAVQDRELCAIHVYTVVRKQEADVRLFRKFPVGGEEMQVSDGSARLGERKVDRTLFGRQSGFLSGFLVITEQDILAVETDDRAV